MLRALSHTILGRHPGHGKGGDGIIPTYMVSVCIIECMRLPLAILPNRSVAYNICLGSWVDGSAEVRFCIKDKINHCCDQIVRIKHTVYYNHHHPSGADI